MTKIIVPVLTILALGLPVVVLGAGSHDFPLAVSRVKTAPVKTAKVVSVIDGYTVILNDARKIRLAGIQVPVLAPNLVLDRAKFAPSPLAKTARKLLSALILNRSVKLYRAVPGQDRYGRVLAQLVRARDGLWLQGALLEAGLARVSVFSNPALASALLQRERQARAAGRGIWGLSYYAIRTPTTVRPDIGTFQIVEGTVINATRVRSWIYLNFGTNWRTDFTVKINIRYEKQFLSQGLNPLALKGSRIRVRGWVRSENGPLITLRYPERLEMISKSVKVPR